MALDARNGNAPYHGHAVGAHVIDVILYDLDRAYCPPGLSAPVGGSEVELYQLADAFRRAGLKTELVLGRPDHGMGPCRVLIFWRQVEPVNWCTPSRRIVRATDNIVDGYHQEDGLLTVCVSKWQAAKFSTPTAVVPPMLGAHVDVVRTDRHEDHWIYAAAANKGILETLQAWRKNPRGPSLVVTTTGYDDPPAGLCEEYGAMWLGRMNPVRLACAIGMARGMYYRNAAPETFGVTTAIAVRLGLELDIECVGHDACGLAESRVPQDLSEATIVKRWLEVLT